MAQSKSRRSRRSEPAPPTSRGRRITRGGGGGVEADTAAAGASADDAPAEDEDREHATSEGEEGGLDANGATDDDAPIDGDGDGKISEKGDVEMDAEGREKVKEMEAPAAATGDDGGFVPNYKKDPMFDDSSVLSVPSDDDSSYALSNGGNDDDVIDRGDDINEESCERRGGSEHGKPKPGDVVRIKSGEHEGITGRVVVSKNGWYYLNEECGVTCVRARDLVVVEPAGGGKKRKQGGTARGMGEDVGDDDLSCYEDVDLVGATVRVKSGRFQGLAGVVSSRESYRHVQIDTSPPTPVPIAHVKVLDGDRGAVGDTGNDESLETHEELSRRYTNARVKVIEPDENAGLEGTVQKTIVGSWYITDNPDITNAYRSDKFEVLQYAPGALEAAKAARRAKRAKIAVAVKEEMAAAENFAVKDDPDDVGTKEEKDAVGAREEGEDNDASGRNLIGATIRIKKGRYKDLTGVITEKQTVRRIQLDTVPIALDFGDVRVIEYAAPIADPSITDDEFGKKYQKYVGARVKVLAPMEHAGTEGKVIRVIILGDWYITDNPEIPRAFQEHKFDVIKWPSGDENEDSNEESALAMKDVTHNVTQQDDVGMKDNIVNDGGSVSCPGLPIVEKEDHERGEKESSDQSEDKDSTDAKSGKKSRGHVLVGATAYVYHGQFKGLSGTITKVHERGHMDVDGVPKRVHVKFCKLVDDGKIDLSLIRDRYRSHHNGDMTRRMPGIVKPGQDGKFTDEKPRSQDRGEGRRNRKAPFENDNTLISPLKSKVEATDFTGYDSSTEQRKGQKLGVIAGGGSNVSSIIPPLGNSSLHNRHPKARDSVASALSPIMLRTNVDNDGSTQLPMITQLLPIGLRHLPTDARIEIFDRKTGKVMRGDDAIPLSDLPNALLHNAEYEPIVPPPRNNASITSRVGRSGANVRVSRNITPQIRVRSSKLEGRIVLVTRGEYRGRSGKVDSCMAGGWYLVSNIFKNSDTSVVINSSHLELIPTKIASTRPAWSPEKEDEAKTRIQLKAAKLRLDAFTEQKEKLGAGQPARKKNLDDQIEDARKLVEELEGAVSMVITNIRGQN